MASLDGEQAWADDLQQYLLDEEDDTFACSDASNPGDCDDEDDLEDALRRRRRGLGLGFRAIGFRFDPWGPRAAGGRRFQGFVAVRML